MYELQYVPLALPFFLFLVGLFVFLVILIQVRVLQYAYAKLGLSSSAALLLLLASLIGSYFDIPIAELPEREVRSGQVVDFFGMRYVVPLVTDWPTTVIAVNIGGAAIPTLLSLYLLLKNRIWSSAAVTVTLANGPASSSRSAASSTSQRRSRSLTYFWSYCLRSTPAASIFSITRS